VAGLAMLTFGVVFGVCKWVQGFQLDILATPGTVMLASLPVILGTQLLLSFLNYDMADVPREPIHGKLSLLWHKSAHG